MSFTNVALEVVVPILGILLTVFMYGSPLVSVLKVRRERRLGGKLSMMQAKLLALKIQAESTQSSA
jgi:hypothetical protein